MEFTVDIEVDNVMDGWADSNLDDRIETWMEGNSSTDVERAIRELLDGFTPGGGGCRTARMFEEAVNGILDNRGEIVLQPASDAIAHLVKEEVSRQLGRAVYQMSQMYTPLHGGAA